MNRLSLTALSLIAVSSVAYVLTDPPVNLQPSSPGTQQIGNINVSGKILGGTLSATNSSTSAQAVIGNATATTGSTYGGLFKTSSSTGTGVRGVSTATTGGGNGGTFQSSSPTGAGVRGFSTAISGVNYGVYGKAVSAGGFAVFAEGNLHATGTISGNGSGLTGVNAATLGGFAENAFLKSIPVPLNLNGNQANPTIYATNSTANAQAVKGYSGGNYGTGVYGVASGGGGSTGVYGENSNESGIGVTGYASMSGFGVTGIGGYFTSAGASGQGLHAVNVSSSGTTYGVVGEVFSASGYGLYALGRTGASGTKSFRIDHPFDPENKYLLHYSAEGPDVLNVYTGNVRTDERGYATITLPAYFSEINKEPRYTLTVVDDSDDFVLAKVAKEIAENRFVVRTSKALVKVSWRVEAIRNDRWMREHGAPVEEEKVGVERGTYQHPDLYGMPASRGVSYRPERPKDPTPRQAR